MSLQLLYKNVASILDLAPRSGGTFKQNGYHEFYSQESQIVTYSASLGNVNILNADASQNFVNPNSQAILSSGTSLNHERARFLSLMEALERYCSLIHFHENEILWASANELGGAALDLGTLPKCSATEFSHPKCVLRPTDKATPIRWVRAVSLLNGKIIFVPAIAVYLGINYACLAERICIPISTGCAAHTSYEMALVHALLEVVERDAISLVWLQTLSLPRIEVDNISPELLPYWQSCESASKDTEHFFFDATTDLGIPTVYGLQVNPANDRTTTLISCCTSMDPNAAIAKVILDMFTIKLAFRRPSAIPKNWDDYKSLMDGATFMAHREQLHAFQFLLKSKNIQQLSKMPTLNNRINHDTLPLLLSILQSKGLDAYAIDLTTDEAVRAGACVVRVVIPGLQPFSFHYRTRYLAHPRLYDAPKNMGYRVHDEANINSWPQPFA